jgi:hypothetical protein
MRTTTRTHPSCSLNANHLHHHHATLSAPARLFLDAPSSSSGARTMSCCVALQVSPRMVVLESPKDHLLVSTQSHCKNQVQRNHEDSSRGHFSQHVFLNTTVFPTTWLVAPLMVVLDHRSCNALRCHSHHRRRSRRRVQKSVTKVVIRTPAKGS